MNESYSLDKSLQLIKEGDSDEVFVISPFYPFNIKFIRDFFQKLSLDNIQYIFSSLNIVKSLNIESFSYNNLLSLYARIINLLPNKKIHLISFGIFANLFVSLAFNLRNKISSITLLEPDFSYIIFNKLFDSKKKPFNKNKFIVNYFLENEKKSIDDNYLSKIKIEYLKYFYRSTQEGQNKDKLRELVDYIPLEIERGVFKGKIFDRILNKKDKKFLLNYYKEEKGSYVINSTKLSNLEILKIRKIFDSVDYITNVFVYWKIMSRESWPLAQILEEYQIPLFNMHENIYNSFVLPDEKLVSDLKKHLL